VWDEISDIAARVALQLSFCGHLAVCAGAVLLPLARVDLLAGIDRWLRHGQMKYHTFNRYNLRAITKHAEMCCAGVGRKWLSRLEVWGANSRLPKMAGRRAMKNGLSDTSKLYRWSVAGQESRL
jgi:hypothetical protein